jgi:hypothetical protein
MREKRIPLSEAARALGYKGGQSRSKAKVRASRENGALGGRPRKHPIADAYPIARFLGHCASLPTERGCILWVGAKNNRGYGSVRVNGVTRGAHRLAWELAFGPIPSGVEVLHRCDNRPCVNTGHLFLGSQRDNIHDMIRKGRDGATITGAARKKTVCKRGHPFDSTNTGRRTDRPWERVCLTCARERTKEWGETHPEQRKRQQRNRKR